MVRIAFGGLRDIADVGGGESRAAEESLVVVGRKDADGVLSYQPLTSVTGTRSETNLLNVPQAIDVVPQQVITDQAVSSLDEALYNVSGITQANTLGGTQDAVMKRGFGDNRDGSILRDGVRLVQARNFTPTTERVEVLRGRPRCCTAWASRAG